MHGKETNTEQTEYEKRLRRRLKILKEKFEEGNIHIAKDLELEKSLLAVKKGSDGEIDLDTVDGSVRSMALAVTAMHDREELKKEASLSEIQNLYFEFIERNFNKFYKMMCDNNLTPHDIGNVVSKNQRYIEDITKDIDEFLDKINQFWEAFSDIAYIHVEDMHGNIKGIFGGDLFPAHDENLASKCGIYTDTLILPDPFLRSKHIFESFTKDSQAYYFIKHAMNILQYKDLACADVDIPIIAIIPDQSLLQDNEREFLHSLGKEDTLIHAGKLFGRDFDSFDHLINFAQDLDSIERAVAEIKDEKRVLFDTEWTGNVSSQLEQAMESDTYKSFVDSPGMLLASLSVGRMSVSNELLVKSRRLNGTPIIDAPTSWQYLAWKMEYDSERTESTTGKQDLHIMRGLQDLSINEMEWLGDIPIDALIEIRKLGAMDDIRAMIGDGINEIIESNPTNFHRSRDHIFDNLNEAFSQHKNNIEELKAKKWKFAGKDIGSWMVTGSLGVTAAVTGVPVWGIAAIAADQLLDAPKLKDIPQTIRDLADESNKIKKSPVGMLFSVKEKSRQ